MQGLPIKPRLTHAASFSSQFILETPASNFQGWARRGLSLPPDICMCFEDPNTGSLAGIAISSMVGQSPKPQISETSENQYEPKWIFILFCSEDMTPLCSLNWPGTHCVSLAVIFLPLLPECQIIGMCYHEQQCQS